MEKEQEAFDAIRKQLQLILIRAEVCQNSQMCGPCTVAVSEIVREIRNLETWVRERSLQGSHPEETIR